MNQDQFTQMMQESASDAVALSVEEYDVELDFNTDSVEKVDHLLATIATQPLNDKELFTYSYIYGAYLGEVFIRSFGGQWLYVSETNDEPPQCFVKIADNTIAFPSKVYHRLMGSEEQSLTDYFAELAELQID